MSRLARLTSILAAAALLLAACAETPSPSASSATYRQSTSQLPERGSESFQSQLDAAGVPLQLPAGRAILVNIPSYELIAFEDGVPVLRSRVIIGTAKDRTPRVDTYTSQVLLHPTWQPTPEMIRSGEVSPGIRPPGEKNPIGLAAVRLGPGMMVYMHDTNQRYLFTRDQRAFSHGCIRVERWDELVAWIMGQDLAWVHANASTPPFKAFEAPAVPVMIRYYRQFPDENGRVLLHPDIYGLGGRVAALPRG